MKSPLARRILLLSGAVLCLANAECAVIGDHAADCQGGECGAADGGFGLSDLGMGGGNSDLGAIFGDVITMTLPKPLASNVPVDTNLELEVGVGVSSPSAYEPNITLAHYLPDGPPADMAVPAVAGAFSWKQPTEGGPARLTLIPNAPLDPDTDYVVHVISPSTGQPVLSTGFSTGSRPRVTAIQLQISTGPSVSLDISFSEPMNAVSLASRVTALSGTNMLTGMLSAGANGDAVLQITNPAKIGGTLTVRIDPGVTAAVAVNPGTLIPRDWDALPRTDISGNFQYTFTGVSTAQPSTQAWAPTVN
jgi:hypothetical protein